MCIITYMKAQGWENVNAVNQAKGYLNSIWLLSNCRKMIRTIIESFFIKH